MSDMTYIHPFTDSGLGQAPFKLHGIWSAPAKSLAETNLDAYNAAMRSVPDVVNKAGWQCQHCYRPLMHFCIISNAAGEKSVVGTTCCGKTGDAKLVTAAKAAERERQRELRKVRAEAKREKQHREAMARHTAECEANGGVSDFERDQATKMNAEHDAAKAFAASNPEMMGIANALEDGSNGFRDSVARSIRAGESLSDRAASIVCDIMAKFEGRRNSKAYNAEYDRVECLIVSD